jgi:hypothetical protein
VPKAAFISQKKWEDILPHEDFQQAVTKAKLQRALIPI